MTPPIVVKSFRESKCSINRIIGEVGIGALSLLLTNSPRTKKSSNPIRDDATDTEINDAGAAARMATAGSAAYGPGIWKKSRGESDAHGQTGARNPVCGRVLDCSSVPTKNINILIFPPREPGVSCQIIPFPFR